MTAVRAALVALPILLSLVLAPTAGAQGAVKPPETALGAAREESGVKERPRSRFPLPGGELRLSASELLASSQARLQIGVTLDRPAGGAALELTLPKRWTERSEISGLPFARVTSEGRGASGRAGARRAGRVVTFAFGDGRAGDKATFSLEDVGLPAGTYALPYRWRGPGGRVAQGTAKVIVYARVRESTAPAPVWPRLTPFDLEINATADEDHHQAETFLTVVPGNKKRFVVGANTIVAKSQVTGDPYGAWITDDGGQTFTKADMPVTTDTPGASAQETVMFAGDPMSAADAAGNIWFGGMTHEPPASPTSRIVVGRIAAGEKKFQPVTVGLEARTAGLQDKPMMTIDNSPSSPTRGMLYVVWNEPAGDGGSNTVMSQCDTRPGTAVAPEHCDEADNWSSPVSVTPEAGSYIYADVAVGPDGKVHVVWLDSSSNNAIRGDVCNPASQNCASAGGWGTPQTIATLDKTGATPVPFVCPILAQPGGRAGAAPQVEVDRSGGLNNGRVYVTWGDLRAGSGTTKCSHDTPPSATHLSWDVFVASKAGALPGGAASSASVGTRLLSENEPGGQTSSDDWMPWLSVDQTTGQPWAAFYSTRHDAARKQTHFYARTVTPWSSGHTLGKLERLSSQPSDYSGAACCTFGLDYGDYTAIDATERTAIAVWSDKRAGSSDGEAYVNTLVQPRDVVSAGSVDPAFAATRTLMASGTAIARGPQTGRYYVAGHADYEPTDGYADSEFMRLLPDGRLDFNNFNNTEAPARCGKPLDDNTTDYSHCGVNTQQFEQHTFVHDVALQPSSTTEGKMVVAGAANFHGGYLKRMTELGYTDTSFGDGGIAEGGEACSFTSLAVQSDRKLVTGTACPNAGVMRFTPDGDRDATFGSAGLHDIYPEGSGCCEATHAVLEVPSADGLIAMVSGPPAVIRLNGDGSRRTAWGSNGMRLLPALDPAHLYDYGDHSLIRLRNGAFLASRGDKLVRLTSTGAIDREFGDNGTATINVSTSSEGITALAEQADGRVIAVGTYGGNGDAQRGGFVARLTQDGRPDTTFGNLGRVLRPGTDSPGGSNLSWTDVVLDPATANSPAGKATVVGHDRTAMRYALGTASLRNTQRPTITGAGVKDGMELTATTGTWQKVDPAAAASAEHGYRWLRCNTDGGACATILRPDGAPLDSPKYTLTPNDIGRRMRVRVTALIDGALNSATTAPTGTVTAVLPAASSVPELSAPVLRAGQAVAVKSDGTWTGTEPRTYAHRWMRCTTIYLASCEPIFRATGKSYRLTDRDAGKRIRLRVTATNVGGSKDATSAVSGVVAAGSPFRERPQFDAFSDFKFSPQGPHNPESDVYGTPDVWSYAFAPYDTVADETTHRIFGSYYVHLEGETQWWNTNLGYGYSRPMLGTVHGAPPTGLYLEPGMGHAPVVRWRNAGAAGKVAVTGTVTDGDGGCGDGVRWVLSRGSQIVLEGTIPNNGKRTFPSGATEAALLGNLAVGAGERISLAIASAGDDACDRTWVDLRITQREPEVAVDGPAQDAVTASATPLLTGRASTLAGDSTTVGVTLRNAAGAVVSRLSPVRTATGAWSVRTGALRDGTYTATASQQASSGHIGLSLPRRFVVDVP